MAKLPYIEFANGMRIPILHEDRNVIAIDKPQGWMLAPVSWQSTGRNLFAALTSSVSAGDFWAQSRNLKFIRFAHRLDAETSGVLLLVKAPGAMPAYTELFEDRKVEKVYLAVVKGVPEVLEWKCRLRVAPMQDRPGRMEINNAHGKDAETLFRVIDKRADRALLMCWPLTGRTHQIRLHLAAVGHPILGDELYGELPLRGSARPESSLALRAVRLSYKDPFMAEQVIVNADTERFVKVQGFDSRNAALRDMAAPARVLEHPKARFEELRRAEKEKRQRERQLRREERPADERPDFPPRRKWQDDERAGFGAERAGFGEEPSRQRPRREFGERTPRKASFGRTPFSGHREFAKGAGGSVSQRPRSFVRQSRAGEQGGHFHGASGPKGVSGRGDSRGQPRSLGKRDFDRRGSEGLGRARPGGSRPGVFKSSANRGLKSGFQNPGGFGSGRRPFTASASGPSFKSPGGGGSRQGNRFRGRSDDRRQSGRPFGKHATAKGGWGKKSAGRPFRKFSKAR